jgi:DinB family protein
MRMNAKLVTTALLLALSAAAFAQNLPPTPKTVTEILQRSVTNSEKQFVDAAEAMPADKFDFAPTAGEFKGVRTFGQLLKHTAATNMFVASVLLGEKPPAGGFEGPEDVKGKDAILKYVKDSFEAAQKAVAKVDKDSAAEQLPNPFNPKGPNVTRLGMSLIFLGHTADEYGQMVEYLRMNNIIPPASRKS